MASMSPAGTTAPQSGATHSGLPPESKVITGVEQASASMFTRPRTSSAQRFERPGHLHFFDRIELTAGNLFPVAQRVENVQFLAHDFSSLFNNVPKSHCYKISPIVKFYLELQIYKYDT